MDGPWISPREKKIGKNDTEFDFSIGHALVFFSVFMNNKQKNVR